MAVTAPTPPTPPTKPVVPGVTLDGDAKVTTSTVPQNKSQTNDEINDAAARQSVAEGNGGLTKIETGTPEKQTNTNEQNANAVQNQNREQQNNSQPANSENNNANNANIIIQQSALPSNALRNDTAARPNLTAEDKAFLASQGTEESTEVNSNSDVPSHGALYWGFTLAAAIFLIAVCLKTFLDKKEEVSKTEPDIEIRPGMKVGEVLNDIAERPKAMPKKTAAEIYKAQEKPPLTDKPKNIERKPKEKEEHFEVRI